MGAAIRKTNHEQMTAAEKWSLLMDGEMSEQELDALLAQYAKDSQLPEDWQTYHVIGDVLRSQDFAQAQVNLSSVHFMEEFRAKLQNEPVIVAPVTLPRSERKKSAAGLHWTHMTGWLAASGFVVMAVVAVVYATQDAGEPISPSATVVAMAPSTPQMESQPRDFSENLEVSASAPAAPVAAAGQPALQEVDRNAVTQGSSVPRLAEPIVVARSSRTAGTYSPDIIQVDAYTPRIAQAGLSRMPLSAVPSEPDIRLVDTPHGRVWRDQRLEPYIFAHQQFRNGLALDMPSDGYMLSSVASNSPEH